MLNWIRSTWCKSMHTETMWPMHGKYICPRCLREYPVAWEGPATVAEYAPNLPDAIEHIKVLGPPDIEEIIGKK